MPVIKADPAILERQAELHRNIAQLYRDVHDHTQGQGTSIVTSFHHSGHEDYAGQYQQWLSSDSFDQIHHEAQIHDAWAEYFSDLAHKIRLLERVFADAAAGAIRHKNGVIIE